MLLGKQFWTCRRTVLPSSGSSYPRAVWPWRWKQCALRNVGTTWRFSNLTSKYEINMNTDLKMTSKDAAAAYCEAPSLQRMSKSTKRRAIGQGGQGINSKPAGYDRSQKTAPYLRCLQWASRFYEAPVVPFRGTLSDLRKGCAPQNFTNPDFHICRNSTHDPSHGVTWCYLLIWYTYVYCESYSCVLRN